MTTPYQRIGATTLVGIFVSLAAKSAFDTFYKDLVHVSRFSDLWANIAGNTGTTLLLWLQLATFLFTLMRFALGAMWYFQQEADQDDALALVIDIFANFIIFTTFYITSLLVRTTSNAFYFSFLTIYAVELLIVSFMRINKHWKRANVYQATSHFQVSDVVSIILLGISLLFFSPSIVYFKSVFLLCLIAIGCWELGAMLPHYVGRQNRQLPTAERSG